MFSFVKYFSGGHVLPLTGVQSLMSFARLNRRACFRSGYFLFRRFPNASVRDGMRNLVYPDATSQLRTSAPVCGDV